MIDIRSPCLNTKTFSRYIFVIGALLLGGAVLAWWAHRPAPAGLEVTVYKDPNCGCCNKWIDHLRDNGFKVTAIDRRDLGDIKQRLGITREVASCHTARVGDYLVEGHVPADLIRRLLKERPDVVGIAVPGMPVGSPGMEGPNPPAMTSSPLTSRAIRRCTQAADGMQAMGPLAYTAFVWAIAAQFCVTRGAARAVTNPTPDVPARHPRHAGGRPCIAFPAR